ncbi:hypothetical protein [Thalassobellus citreus]|uniref:hypothetical protein n=1 Tax=Thalassobellus citreus TaxID=3367752 RepID=UPI0037A088F1
MRLFAYIKKYNSCHSVIKICISLGIENHLLPNEFIASINPSTDHYWKQDNPDKYMGAEFASTINHNLDDLQYFQDRPILSNTIIQEVDFFVHDYNNVRPHYEYLIYTPNEIYKNPN